VTSLSHQDNIGSNSWWLKATKGFTKNDKCILSFLKIVYLGIRFLLKITLGTERRNRIYRERGINFRDFLYNSVNFLRLRNLILLEIGVPKYDYKVCCPLNEEVFGMMTKHEDGIIDRFSPREGDVVVDVGAHMGRYTLISSKHVGQNGKVIAIEAHPGNFEILNRNIKLNKLTNVIPLNYAVYSEQTKLKLYLPVEESGFTIYNTIMVNRTESGEKFIEVNANTLDNLLLQQQQNGISHAEVNWIKIDVEGAEFEVLKGAHNVLSKSKDIAILIEVHNLRKDANLYRPIIEFLNLYNFKIEFEKIHDGGERHIIVRKQL
jgi:FkbM family methyltransferase